MRTASRSCRTALALVAAGIAKEGATAADAALDALKKARALGAYQLVLAELECIKEIAASRNAGPKPAPR